MLKADLCWCQRSMNQTRYSATGRQSKKSCPSRRWTEQSVVRCDVVAFDTNVLVRVLTGDDPVQTRKAERALVEHASGEGIFVSLVVLAELAWVLSAAYEWNRTTIQDRLSRLLRTRGISFEDLDLVESALAQYRVGKADLADYLVLGKAQSVGADLLTFDKRLAQEEGVKLL